MKTHTKGSKKPNIEAKVPINVPQYSLWIKMAIFVFAFLVYGKTLNFQFALDDDMFFLKHSSVQKGVDGIAEIFTHGSLEKFDDSKGLQPYRPLTLLSFALQKQLFGNDAKKAHLINVLLYALLLLVLFDVLRQIFRDSHPYFLALIVFLYAAHPVHTEVVANVKSRDELLVVLFSLAALYWAIKKVSADASRRTLALSSLFFGLALFSKENGIAMTLIIPLAIYFFQTENIKNTLSKSIPYIVITLVFLGIRAAVIPNQVNYYQVTEYENILYGANGFIELFFTKIYLLFYYLKLLFIPWPLTWDYSYGHFAIVDAQSLIAWFSLILHIGLLGLAIFYVKTNKIRSFSIFFYLITLAPISNFFFLNGSTFAERFLFLPSLGFAIAFVYEFSIWLKIDIHTFKEKKSLYLAGIICVIILIFTYLSMIRTSEWESNFTLFQAGVQGSTHSSRADASFASEYRTMGEREKNPLQRKEYFSQAIKYYNVALSKLPSNTYAAYNLGVVYTENRDTAKAVQSYRQALRFDPNHLLALNNMGMIYSNQSKLDSAYHFLNRSYQLDKGNFLATENLAAICFIKKDYPKAIELALEAVKLNADAPKCYIILKESYRVTGNDSLANYYTKLFSTH